MAKKTKRAASKSSGSSAEYKAVIDDLVMGNRILYDQGVVDGYGHVSARDPRDPERLRPAGGTATRFGPALGDQGFRPARRADPRRRAADLFRTLHSFGDLSRAAGRARRGAQPFTNGRAVHGHQCAAQADPRLLLLSRSAAVRHPRRCRLDQSLDLQPRAWPGA